LEVDLLSRQSGRLRLLTFKDYLADPFGFSTSYVFNSLIDPVGVVHKERPEKYLYTYPSPCPHMTYSFPLLRMSTSRGSIVS